MSITETLFLVVGALILFGPKKLPEIARQLGKIVGELRRASAEFRFQIEDELRVSDEAERRKKANAAAAPSPQPPMPRPPVGETPVSRSTPILDSEGSVTDPQPPAPPPEPAGQETAHG